MLYKASIYYAYACGSRIVYRQSFFLLVFSFFIKQGTGIGTHVYARYLSYQPKNIKIEGMHLNTSPKIMYVHVKYNHASASHLIEEKYLQIYLQKRMYA